MFSFLHRLVADFLLFGAEVAYSGSIKAYFLKTVQQNLVMSRFGFIVSDHFHNTHEKMNNAALKVNLATKQGSLALIL